MEVWKSIKKDKKTFILRTTIVRTGNKQLHEQLLLIERNAQHFVAALVVYMKVFNSRYRQDIDENFHFPLGDFFEFIWKLSRIKYFQFALEFKVMDPEARGK